MNRSVLARIGPALFAFYVLAYAAFFAWAWFIAPVDMYLPIFRAEQAARRALLELLAWIAPLTAAAVVTALSLAAGSAKRGSPALPFNQLVASAVLTFLVLATGVLALSETVGAGSSRRLSEMAWQTRLAGQYKALAEKSRSSKDWSRAAEYDQLYLKIDPDNDDVEGARTTDEANASREKARGAASAVAAAKPPTGVDAGSLVKKATAYFDQEDWYSALWYARQAEQIDPTRADATRLAARALEQINGGEPPRKQTAEWTFYDAKMKAFEALNRKEWTAAYYQFKALTLQRPADADAKRFMDEAGKELGRLAFFSDDADTAAALPGIEKMLWFNVNDATATEAVWAGRMVTITREGGTARWFFDVEAIRYDAKGAVTWHLSAPRARLSDDETMLLLKGVDRIDPKKATEAVYHAGSRPAVERNTLRLGKGVEDLPIHALDRAPLAGTSMAELWRIRRSLARTDRLHTEVSVELATRAANPFVFLVVSLFAVAFGWSLRGRWTGRAPALAYIAAPAIVAAVGIFVQLYLHAHRVLLGFVVLSLGGLTAAAIVLGVLQLVLVAVALAVLAGQSTA
jgi:tetratricopeptide (TPR) repeat protein